MKYLLDTHTVIWYLEASPRLRSKMRTIIDHADDRRYISSASLWETAIKVNLGKLKLKSTFESFLAEVRNSDIKILQIKDEYLKRLAVLPLIHKDPFDRLLISTALAEKLTIITADENIQQYDVPWVW